MPGARARRAQPIALELGQEPPLTDLVTPTGRLLGELPVYTSSLVSWPFRHVNTCHLLLNAILQQLCRTRCSFQGQSERMQ